MWMLALGAGMLAGEVERPVFNVHLASTAGKLPGIKAGEMTGRPLREILS